MEMNQFFVAGINYKKTDAAIRGKFAIGADQYASLLQKASDAGLSELFVLSTCNRTEIYGIAPSASTLINLLCSETVGDNVIFQQLCYTKQGNEAIEHIFSVGAGLDSQILGDYEIVGQTGGMNYETGEMEHYRLTLQVTDYSEFESGS